MQPQLTETNVLDIKRIIKYSKINNRLNKTKIANDFNVSRKTIYDIDTGDTWNNVPLPRTHKKFSDYLIYHNGRIFDKVRKRFPIIIDDYTVNKKGPVQSVMLFTKRNSRKVIPVAQLLTETFGRKFGKSFLRLS